MLGRNGQVSRKANPANQFARFGTQHLEFVPEWPGDHRQNLLMAPLGEIDNRHRSRLQFLLPPNETNTDCHGVKASG